MNATANNWIKPRTVSVVIDNPSWILPYAEQLVQRITEGGDHAHLCRSHTDVVAGTVAFYLGCVSITPNAVLARNGHNLVVHESDLPRGRGFSPLTWQILEGQNEIPVCLLEAATEVDAGLIIYREKLHFQGHELINELRAALGGLTEELCLRYLREPVPPLGQAQSGITTHYVRRLPQDSRLDPERSLVEQFNLLRVVDNVRYPAFFDLNGCRYRLSIEKVETTDEDARGAQA